MKADDPKKDQSRRPRAKADDPWAKADDPIKILIFAHLNAHLAHFLQN